MARLKDCATILRSGRELFCSP